MFAMKKPALRTGYALAAACLIMASASGCSSGRLSPPDDRKPTVMVLKTTGYCNCGKCCNWKRRMFGLGSPVIASGPHKGRPKVVGRTASGATAQDGTVAADTTLLPMNTIMHIPGYGFGRVEDRGGAIKGKHVDLWFPTHREAKNWGVRTLQVKVWRP